MAEPRDTDEARPAMRIGDREYGGQPGVIGMGVIGTGAMAPSKQNEIGWAVKQMWNGQAVTRRAWYGRHSIRLQVPDVNSKMNQPYVYIKTQRGEITPWLASQADLLATDWQLHEVD